MGRLRALILAGLLLATPAFAADQHLNPANAPEPTQDSLEIAVYDATATDISFTVDNLNLQYDISETEFTLVDNMRISTGKYFGLGDALGRFIFTTGAGSAIWTEDDQSELGIGCSGGNCVGILSMENDAQEFRINLTVGDNWQFYDQTGTQSRFLIEGGGTPGAQVLTLSNDDFLGVLNVSPDVALDVTGDAEVSGTAAVTGLISTAVGLDAIGAVDMDYGSADVTDHTFVADGGTVVIDGNFTGALVGNADTATALAADPTDCSAGSYTIGINAAGTAQGCTDATTEIDSVVATHAAVTETHGISAFGKTVVDDADAATHLATVGLSATAAEINTPLDGATVTLTEFEELAAIGATTISAGQWAGLGGATAAGLALWDDANAAAQIATLGLDADIATLALPASTTISAFGKTVVDDADAATHLATVGLTATASEINTPLDGATVTLTEFEELAAVGATTISAGQWAGLGGATAAGLALWDDANAAAQLVTLGVNATESEIDTPLDGALVTLTEFRELEAIDATTISTTQWGALGGATAAGLALWDDADADAQLVSLGLTATATEINTPLDGATVTLTEFEELATVGSTVIAAADWTQVALLDGGAPALTGTNFTGIPSSGILTIVESMSWPAGAFSSDGTQCADPAAATINSGPKMQTVICTDNDASVMQGHTTMPDGWDAGNLTFELAYIQTAANTAALEWDIYVQCRGAAETVNNTWETAVNVIDAGVTGSNGIDHTTSGNVTCASDAAGDELYWKIEIDASGTGTAMATVHFTGVKMEYTSNVGD